MVIGNKSYTYLAGNEFHITRALSVAISSAILSTSLVSRISGQATVLVHLNEVHCTIQATRKLRHVDVEAEFSVLHLHHEIILVIGIHQVHSRANVAASKELELQRIATGADAFSMLATRPAFKVRKIHQLEDDSYRMCQNNHHLQEHNSLRRSHHLGTGSRPMTGQYSSWCNRQHCEPNAS